MIIHCSTPFLTTINYRIEISDKEGLLTCCLSFAKGIPTEGKKSVIVVCVGIPFGSIRKMSL